MQTQIETAEGSEVLEQLLAAQERGDLEAMRRLVHADAVMEWPQSGERFVGRGNVIGGIFATEVKPEIIGEPRIVGGGGVWAMMLPARYGEETWHYVGVFEIAGGQMRRATEYFGGPFPAQEGRARYTDGASGASSA